ncbi:hypothetical protein ACHAXT_005851 [Thalassiosira profunda]
MTHFVALLLVVAIILPIQLTAVMSQGTGAAEMLDTDTRSADPSMSDGISSDAKLAPYLVRLHLVRHGETEANVQNIVLGQGDSPLTDDGVAIARLAAASDMINGKRLRYWRTYCSDLHRAHRTARIVLGLDDGYGNENEACDADLVVDSRLREIAKGAREGYAKNLSSEEAMAARRKDAGLSDNDEGELDVPRPESLDDAWERAKNWIDAMVKDAADDYYSEDGEGATGDELHPRVYDCFALSHSALIRTMIHRMVNNDIPPDHATTKEGSLSIPNLSRTIIDIHPEPLDRDGGSGDVPKWRPSLVRLTDVSHLSGPPYL